ncbi:MAG: InlB B-repeat-containing protein, partial [Erysipelotrichaceae bacterium]|nr:InlB B-repeat-containing protein [Erysipelotrichaceae bacterium]
MNNAGKLLKKIGIILVTSFMMFTSMNWNGIMIWAQDNKETDTFESTTKQMNVTVTAAKDMFPAGTEMKVTDISDEEALQYATENLGEENVKSAKGVDITFFYDGEEIQPADPSKVEVSLKPLKEDISKKDLTVLHVKEKKADKEEAKALKHEIKEIQKIEKKEKKNSLSFTSDGFSVYVVVETGTKARAKVNFHQYGGEVVSIWVKQEDTTDADRFAQVLYDPGAGDLGQSIAFYGWSETETYTELSDKLTIEQIRTAIATELAKESFVDGTEFDYYAAVFKAFIVTYKDPHGIVLGSATNLEQPDVTTSDFTIQMSYTVEDPDQDFKGWFISPASNATLANGDPVSEDTYYPNGTKIKLTGSVELTVDAPSGAWLIFKENGSGSTYTRPQFLEANDVTEEPSNPSRNGYSFEGWYYFPDGNAPEPVNNVVDLTGATQFTFGSGLNKTTTLYAKWEEAETAKYTVLLWKQNVAGNGYDFYRSWTFEDAVVGSTIQNLGKVSSSGNDDDAYATIDGTAYRASSNNTQIKQDFTGFHFDHFEPDLSTKVKATGDTVINVYYDRNEYTLTFQGYTYTQNNRGNYGLVDGVYVRLVSSYGNRYYLAYNGAPIPNEATVLYQSWGGVNETTANDATSYNTQYYSLNGDPLTWVRYTGNTRYNRNNRQTIKTITALYQQDISSYFPIVGTNGVSYAGYVWDPQNSSVYTSGQVPSIESMQAENTTFIAAAYGNGVTIHMYYYTEAMGDEWDVTYNGKHYVEHQHVTIVSAGGITSTEPEDFIEIPGFSHDGSNPAYTDGRVDLDDSNNYTISFYYARKTYTINFMDGVYLSGNSNEEVDDKHTQQLSVSDPVPYEASLASFADYKPAASNGWAFSGWYLDTACTEPCDFTSTTMPEGGLTVYAKWHNIQYRVFLHPNVPDSTPSDYMGGQATSFRMDYGDSLGFIDAHRDEYELVGWYTDPDFTNQFKFEAYSFNEQTITWEYDKNRSTELNLYGNVTENRNSDINRPWINNCVDLYARWRSKIVGANGITVEYDPGDGTGAPTDDLLYKDLAMAHVGGASIPNDANMVFDYWEIMKYEGNSFVSTGEKAYPGSTFEVKKADAKVEELEGSTEAEPKRKYTVMLRAVYKLKDQETPTHIWWYPNGGSGSVVKSNTLDDGTTADVFPINQAVEIKPADTFTREGYEFIGWYKNSSNVDQPVETVDATEPNFLWYDKETDKFYSDAAKTKEAVYVAADEVTPYDYLYAIWVEKLQVKITGNSDTVPYTGSEQNVTGYTVLYKVGDGEWTEEAPTGVSVTGPSEAKASGTDVGTYPMGLVKGDFTVNPGNYVFEAETDLTVIDGSLEIEPIELKIKVEGNSDTLPYNGLEQNVTGYTVQYSIDGGETWTTTAPTGVTVTGPTEAKASGTDVNTYPMGLKVADFTVTVSNNFVFDATEDLAITDGSLEITPVAITIKADNKTKVYDNDTSTDPTLTATVTGVPTNGVAPAYSLSRDPGQDVDNYTIKVTANDADNPNYTITVEDGVFSITKATLTITAKPQTYTYNGEAQGPAGTYTEGFDSYVTVSGLQGSDALTS